MILVSTVLQATAAYVYSPSTFVLIIIGVGLYALKSLKVSSYAEYGRVTAYFWTYRLVIMVFLFPWVILAANAFLQLFAVFLSFLISLVMLNYQLMY